MNETIEKFIDKQRVATVSCIDEDGSPYCFSCFFVFDKAKACLYFKTSPSSHHTFLLEKNELIAGTIQPDKLNPLAIKGIQYKGKVLPLDDIKSRMASAFYHHRYPFALAMPGEVRIIEMSVIKMTDNSAGFGKKITWVKDAPAYEELRTENTHHDN
jgi:uncharacterized protein